MATRASRNIRHTIPVVLTLTTTVTLKFASKSDPQNRRSGANFDFTATAPFFSSGTVEVPLGECSDRFRFPSGTVTLAETPMIDDVVSKVTAFSYDIDGEYINELKSWIRPDLNANIGIMAGDVSLETVATFDQRRSFAGPVEDLQDRRFGYPDRYALQLYGNRWEHSQYVHSGSGSARRGWLLRVG